MQNYQPDNRHLTAKDEARSFRVRVMVWGLGRGTWTPPSMEVWGLVPRKFLKFDIWTAVKSLALANDWVYSRRGLPKNSSLIDFVHIPQVALVVPADIHSLHSSISKNNNVLHNDSNNHVIQMQYANYNLGNTYHSTHSITHWIHYFRDVPPNQSLCMVMKKLNLTQENQKCKLVWHV